MDESAFLDACRRAVGEAGPRVGIGRLGEKSLHAALKLYLEPDPSRHEVHIGRYVADIVNQRGVVEIQTGGFGRLREKLEFFLAHYPVTVVYPVAAVKRIISIDESGSQTRPRKSPKRGGPWELLTELYSLRELLGRLGEGGLGFCVPLLEVEEYRMKSGGRRGYTRWERMPVRLLDEVWVQRPEDAGLLLPPGLAEVFTAKEFRAAGRFSSMSGSLALTAARELGAVERAGNRGRAYLYRRGGSAATASGILRGSAP